MCLDPAAATTCWCSRVTIAPAALAAVPAEARGRACLCDRCATAPAPATPGVHRTGDDGRTTGSNAAMQTLPDGVTKTRDAGGREAFAVSGPAGRVLVATLGAQVLSWQSPRGEVLFTGSTAEHVPGKPVRGGIPLVFPWFGDHATDKKLPAHGFARTQTWQFAGAGPGPTLTLTTTDDAASRALWPHPYRLSFTVAMTQQPTFRLVVENPGTTPFRCEQALHTYFAVGDVHSASVHGLAGVPYTETAVAPEGPWDTAAPLRFRAETDRVFHGTPARIELHAPALQRRVGLTTRGARSAIVWTPWPTKAARLSGLGADDWQRFCCIESANVRQHAIELAPGGRHELELVLDLADG